MIAFVLAHRGRSLPVRAELDADAIWVGARAVRRGWAGGARRICLAGDGGSRAEERRRAGPAYRRAVDAIVARYGERAVLDRRDE